MVPARVPDPAVVVAGGFGVAVVEHRVERHLKRHMGLARIPRPDADGGGKPAPRALAADHELIVPHAERGGVRAQPEQRRIRILKRRRIRHAPLS